MISRRKYWWRPTAPRTRSWPAVPPSRWSTIPARSLHVVHVGPEHVYPPPPPVPPRPRGLTEESGEEAQGVLDWQVDEITKAGGEVTQAHLRMGSPAEEILHLSEEIVAGLIVVGNQGFGGRFSRMRHILMGSVSEKVTRYARCSVMVIRKDLYDRPSA